MVNRLYRSNNIISLQLMICFFSNKVIDMAEVRSQAVFGVKTVKCLQIGLSIAPFIILLQTLIKNYNCFVSFKENMITGLVVKTK